MARVVTLLLYELLPILFLLLESAVPVHALQPPSPVFHAGQNEVTYDITGNDEGQILQISRLVDALENLGILESDKTHCYALNRIVKTSEPLNDHSWRVGISLHVTELSSNQNRGAHLNRRQNGASGSVTGGAADTDVTKPGAANTNNSNTNNSRCNTNDAGGGLMIPALELLKGSTAGRRTGSPELMSGDAASGQMDNSSLSSGAGDERGSEITNGTAAGITRNKAKQAELYEDDEKRLSRTQLLVIITCSVVIGLFFIAALTMRIRNYWKRVRAEQETARRPAFRSASVALRSVHGSPDNRNSPPAKGLGRSNSNIPLSDDPLRRSSEKPLLVGKNSTASTTSSFANHVTLGHRSSRSLSQKSRDYDDLYDGRTDIPAPRPTSAIPSTAFSHSALPTAVQPPSALPTTKRPPTADVSIKSPTSTLTTPLSMPPMSPETQPSSLYSLSSTGFTQSDSSINSRNHTPYSYGNQTEYAGYYEGAGIEGDGAQEGGDLLRPSPCPSPRPSPRVNRKIFLNRLDTIDTLDPFYVHGSMKGRTLSQQEQDNEDVNNDVQIEMPTEKPVRPSLQRGKPLTSVNEDEVINHEENLSEGVDDLEKELDSSPKAAERNLELEQSVASAQDLPESTSDELKTPSSRKSVTFSVDLEDVVIDEDDNIEDVMVEELEPSETASNDVFTDESSCLLGPEFEGVKPTFV